MRKYKTKNVCIFCALQSYQFNFIFSLLALIVVEFCPYQNDNLKFNVWILGYPKLLAITAGQVVQMIIYVK